MRITQGTFSFLPDLTDDQINRARFPGHIRCNRFAHRMRPAANRRLLSEGLDGLIIHATYHRAPLASCPTVTST